MKKSLKNLLFTSCALLLSACATTQNYQQAMIQWQGVNSKELINRWGYPDAGIKLPNGNTVYVYTRQQTYITPATPLTTPTIINVPGTPMAVNNYNGDFVGGQTITSYCRTWFEVDPKGIIVNTRFQGNNCVARNVNKWAP